MKIGHYCGYLKIYFERQLSLVFCTTLRCIFGYEGLCRKSQTCSINLLFAGAINKNNNSQSDNLWISYSYYTSSLR